MSEMVERVAKAIRGVWIGPDFTVSDVAEDMARAAIAAMREPSGEMLKAIADAVLKNAKNKQHLPITWTGGYRIMVDAALAEWKKDG
jgi:hypothetical protein